MVTKQLQSIGVTSSVTEQETGQNPMPKNFEVCRNWTGVQNFENLTPYKRCLVS